MREEILNPVDMFMQSNSPALDRRCAREFKTANSEFAYTSQQRSDDSMHANGQTPTFSHNEINSETIKCVWKCDDNDRLDNSGSPEWNHSI